MNWKDIPGLEGFYQASDCGSIKSLKREVLKRDGKIQKVHEKILKNTKDSYGYNIVSICINGYRKAYKVHRLIMYAHSYVDEIMTVNHKDGNKQNNHISNLEYLTTSDNVKHFRRNNPNHSKNLGKKVLDTETGTIYRSIAEASLSLYKNGESNSVQVWSSRIKEKRQNRFILLN
jgi:hypothetical protein